MLPSEGVILTIKRIKDEGAGLARFCMVDDANNPFKDPYTNRNTWTRESLNNILKCVSWRVGNKVRFSARGYEVVKASR